MYISKVEGLVNAEIVTTMLTQRLGHRYHDDTDRSLVISPFVNGREEGYKLGIYDTGFNARYAAIVECKNSDSIVVFYSDEYLGSNSDNIDKATRVFYACGAFELVTEHLMRFVADGRVPELTNYESVS